MERAHPKVDGASHPWCRTPTVVGEYVPVVPDSPLDAHVATPQDLKDRIAAERRGTPFLIYRDVDDRR